MFLIHTSNEKLRRKIKRRKGTYRGKSYYLTHFGSIELKAKSIEPRAES